MLKKDYAQLLLPLAWVTAVFSTIVSLAMSEIFHFAPCVLCWYQRICMYPLVVLIFMGIQLKDRRLYAYVLPLTATGWLIALYHTLLQWQILPEAVAPCTAGVSCVTKQLNYFGFVTIPFMSLLAFSLITILMLVYWRLGSENRE